MYICILILYNYSFYELQIVDHVIKSNEIGAQKEALRTM